MLNIFAKHGMYDIGYFAVNTDPQALDSMPQGVERIQIGHARAGGLGAGADYQVADQAARDDDSRLRKIVEGADMVFIAAGMGGGTGTGAAPVVAELCREQKILTVAVVTKPFSYENRDEAAEHGISRLTEQVDSLIIVPNDRVLEHYGNDVRMDEIFQRSDDVLINAVTGICDIITKPGQINVDFADVRSVMREMGQAMMGTAVEQGPARAETAVKKVIECPLLEGIEISNARGLLVNISASQESMMAKEVMEVMNVIKDTVSADARIFQGVVYDEELGDRMRITLIATGLRRGASARVRAGGARPGNGSGWAGTAFKSPLMHNARRQIGQQTLLQEEQTPSILRNQKS